MRQFQKRNAIANVREQIDRSARAEVEDDAGGSFASPLVPVAVAAGVIAASGRAVLLLIFAVLRVVPSGAIEPFQGVRRSVGVSALASGRVLLPRSCHRRNSYIDKNSIHETKNNEPIPNFFVRGGHLLVERE